MATDDTQTEANSVTDDVTKSRPSLEPLIEPSEPSESAERASSPPQALPAADPVPLSHVRYLGGEVEDEDPPPVRHLTVNFAHVWIIDRSHMVDKAFLGGFRNTKTGVEYLHASSQTPPLNPLTVAKVQKYHRETQTKKTANASYQPPRDASTQMARSNVYWLAENGQDVTDKVLVPRPYFTADQTDELKWESAIRIQRLMRGFLARRRASKLRAKVEAKKQRLRQEEAHRDAAEQSARERDMERRRNPKTKEDFELLYAELDAWCANEKKRIAGLGLSKEDNQQALKELLSKETQLLQTIDRLKQKAALEAKQARIESKLDHISTAKDWEAQVDPGINNGQPIMHAQVETPFTQRARELRDMYAALSNAYPTLDERLEVLVQVKWTVQEFDCKLTRDIIELIDREGDLINRGRSDSMLTGLRQRLTNLFLQFIESPEFNPEIGRTQKIDLRFRSNVQPLKPRYSSMPRP